MMFTAEHPLPSSQFAPAIERLSNRYLAGHVTLEWTPLPPKRLSLREVLERLGFRGDDDGVTFYPPSCTTVVVGAPEPVGSACRINSSPSEGFPYYAPDNPLGYAVVGHSPNGREVRMPISAIVGESFSIAANKPPRRRWKRARVEKARKAMAIRPRGLGLCCGDVRPHVETTWSVRRDRDRFAWPVVIRRERRYIHFGDPVRMEV